MDVVEFIVLVIVYHGSKLDGGSTSDTDLYWFRYEVPKSIVDDDLYCLCANWAELRVGDHNIVAMGGAILRMSSIYTGSKLG
jgi:hypothetical protein